MSRPRIELGSQELASCAITARPPQHDTTGARHRAFDVFQGSCYTAWCARCKYHAGHYYSVILDGSTRQDEAIAITVRFVNEQWEIIQRLVRIDIVAKFVAGTQLSQVLMASLFTDLQL